MIIKWLKRKWNRLIARIELKVQERKERVNWLKYWHDSRQRHHDYFVFVQGQGKLDPKDQVEYEMAMSREKAGEVKPLPNDATSPFG